MCERKVVLVTGGLRGIGRSCVLAFCKKGYNVAINYRQHDNNHEMALSLKQECEALGGQAYLAPGDVANKQEVQDMFKKIKKHFGRLDVLVNNAGITIDRLFLRMSEDDFNQVIDTNLKGAFLCNKEAARMMMKQRSGAIISLASVVGEIGNIGQVNYAASKAGIIAMSQSLARELASRHIRVNCVAPGFIETDMTRVLSEDIVESMQKRIPLGRFGQVEDVANAIVFLASDEASYITGQVLNIDGGMVM